MKLESYIKNQIGVLINFIRYRTSNINKNKKIIKT